jgi:hypothetical protein
LLRSIVWRELRWRMLAALALVLPHAGLIAVSALTPEHRRAAGVGDDFGAFFDVAWFRAPGPGAILLVAAVILAAGGSLIRPRGDVAYLLALPLSRRRWLLEHLATPLAGVGGVLVAVDLVFAAAALRGGASVPVAGLLLRSLLMLAACAPWIALTVGAVALLRHALPAAVLVLSAAAFLPGDRYRLEVPPVVAAAGIAPWDPWFLADPRAWSGGLPARSVATAVLLALGGCAIGLNRIERYEP